MSTSHADAVPLENVRPSKLSMVLSGKVDTLLWCARWMLRTYNSSSEATRQTRQFGNPIDQPDRRVCVPPEFLTFRAAHTEIPQSPLVSRAKDR